MRYEEAENPKAPAQVGDGKKRGGAERGESRKDGDRDFHRPVHGGC